MKSTSLDCTERFIGQTRCRPRAVAPSLFVGEKRQNGHSEVPTCVPIQVCNRLTSSWEYIAVVRREIDGVTLAILAHADPPAAYQAGYRGAVSFCPVEAFL